MAKYRIFYWKHIPSSITVEGDGRTVKKQLSQKIQNEIDSYAMAEGLTGTALGLFQQLHCWKSAIRLPQNYA